ncbi:serine-rich adhesin for platelets-like [Prorops nasuta]|uniref:serine-rich adhesin for platelets-like n=1 Tax=Prorops nasuta TaxID=863751 RepID=UPI0034CDE9B4
MVDNNCIIEGNVKFRDGKKWKSRWCVMRKLSPVADCLHLQLYGDSKDRYKQGQTKASLSLEHFLGVQSGFTLDKESNTVAIICQDVTVILAFDTRERLIQWQVKISNNLGEDQQFLILISSAPSKAKLSNGPAHLHIQDRRFCITMGIPPRLIGVWEIAHLRRYGVVDGRFCFEGGSRCGRGEGLHVLITDQGEDIVKTLQLAAEGKLSTKKRALGRETSAQESPRRQFSRSETRASDFFPATMYSGTSYEERCDSCKNESSTYWSSTESSRQQTELDVDYSCRDTVSVSEVPDQSADWRSCSLTRQGTMGLERCASCIGKLGTASKSSTLAVTNNASHANSTAAVNNLGCNHPPRAFDRLSLSSYSSSNSHDSDYSGSQQLDYHCTQKNAQNQATAAQRTSSSPANTLPPRPPKPSSSNSSLARKCKKPPMPLPAEQTGVTAAHKQIQVRTSSLVGPYENYDVPRTIRGHHVLLEQVPQQTVDQYYDTPRKIKECLALPKTYPNYDTPQAPQAVLLQQCGCPAKITTIQSNRTFSGCPCHNVMSWAGFVLPYCRRGAGIEPTGVSVQHVRLSGEGKMPVVDANGELNIFTSARKTRESSQGTIERRKDQKEVDDEDCTNNYENVEPVIDKQPESKQANYANIDFTESLEHYENSKDLLVKSGISEKEMQQIAEQMKQASINADSLDKEEDDRTICKKCGHTKDNEVAYLETDSEKDSLKRKKKNPFPGYMTMQSPGNACSKEILSRLRNSGIKSSSNPTLSGSPSSESTRKRSDSEYRIPGSAMLSSPYLRRRLLEAGNSLDGILPRKRSYSVESAHYLDDENSGSFPSNLTIHKCPSETDKTSLTNGCEEACVSSEMKINNGGGQVSGILPSFIKIRRSSSVPSKTGHNRDSSSSNDSGVSTGSLSHRATEFVEFELSLASITDKKQNILSICRKSPPPTCYHSSLPRKTKSSDPLRELSFQFQKIKTPIESSSTDADIPKGAKGYSSPGENSGTPYIDSRSTSSGTSDMSDYIETLSLSSHSSSDTPDNLRLSGRAVATTLRPRSGKEYYKIDRSILVEQGRPLTTSASANYANITPVMEKSESPSPGYMSSSPFEQPQPTRDHFLFPEVSNTS